MTECNAAETSRQKYDQGHTQTRPAADAQNGRIGQRIAEQSLHQQAGDGQANASQKCRNGLWHTVFHNDGTVCVILAVKHRLTKIMKRNGNGTQQQIEGKQHHANQQDADRSEEGAMGGVS